MKVVRIVKSWQRPHLLRQTPGQSGVWGECRFTLDPVETCDYVLALKYNHPTLRAAVAHHFAVATGGDAAGLAPTQAATLDKGHGRLEIRRCWASGDPEVHAGGREGHGMAVKFDLDLFMTGHDLWVTTATVPMIAHYDMLHDKATRTVSSLLMLWDGEQVVDASAGYANNEALVAQLLGDQGQEQFELHPGPSRVGIFFGQVPQFQ